MNIKITAGQLQDFLEDYEQNSSLEILEEGKAKNELIEIAKVRGINLKSNRDLIGFKCIYAFADKPNKNGVYLPEKELLRTLPTMIGKPVNLRHHRNEVVGHLLDYKYIYAKKQVISYGVFYHSCFPEEYAEAKKDFKAKKLNVSFEIWSPKNKRKKRSDGSEELHKMAIAGMAILPKDTHPAFDGARVLEFASKLQVQAPELVYASKYKDEDLIISENPFKDSIDTNAKKLEEEKKPKQTSQIAPEPKKSEEPNPKEEKPKEEPPTPEPTPQDPNKILCKNCNKEFSLEGLTEHKMGAEKCPNCFAIVAQDGKVLYPPQIKDFKISCPKCGMDNWLILEKTEENGKLKCQSCAKEYQISFAKAEKNELFDKIVFVYSGAVSCPQCRKSIDIEGTSQTGTRTVKCKRCSLNFSVDAQKIDSYKQIADIKEIIEESIENSSDKGGNLNMKEPLKCPEKANVTNDEKLVIAKHRGRLLRAVRKIAKLQTASKEQKDKSKVKVESLKSGIKKVALQLITAQAETKKIKEEAEKKIKLYMENAQEIIKRKTELGDFSKDLSDKDILNADKYEIAKLKLENEHLSANIERASEQNDDIVGTKHNTRDESYYETKRNEITEKSFVKNKPKK